MSAEPTAGLGRVVGRGISWSVLGTAWTKAASFAAQIVLGYLLSDGDWGVYAMALSFATLLMALRDGGTFELLVQRGPAGYVELRGPVFWLALAFNAGIGATLALAAPLVAAFYGEPAVAPILWTLAATVPISTPALLLRAKLRVDLRFAALARLGMISAVIRYGGTIALAALGYGPLSFVLPLPMVVVVEFVLLLLLTREDPWAGWPAFQRCWALLPEVKWLVFGTLANVLVIMGDYLVLGRLISAEVLGVYYFAFQLSTHASMLAAADVVTVLMPTLARFVSEPERQRNATLRSIRSLILISVPICIGLACAIQPLETLVWNGLWKSAVPSVQILSVVLPIRLLFMITSSSLKARGAFRRWALIALLQGLGLMVAAGIAGSLEANATFIAGVVAAYFLISCPLTLWLSVADLGIRFHSLLAAFLPAWLIGLGVGTACYSADSTLLSGSAAGARVSFSIVTFSIAYVFLCRVLIPAHVSDTLSVLPARLATIARRLVRLR